MDTKKGEAVIHPLNFGDRTVRQLIVPLEWIVYISELEAKTATHNSKKPCTWLDGELAEKIYTSLTFKPAEQVPDLSYELFAENVDAGIAEILYRLTPGAGFVVVPASLANFLYNFTEESHKKVEETGKSPVEAYKETPKLREELFNRVERARVACIPVQAGRHWTVLIIKRKKAAEAESSTTATNPLGSFDKVRRKAAEEAQFDHPNWPIYPCKLDEEWEVSYIDTLSTPRASCRKVAQMSLDLLTMAGFGTFSGNLLPVKNTYEQKGVTCGLWILHYIEEEARAFLGEKRGSLQPDLEYRRGRINAMQDALLTRKAQKDLKEKDEAAKEAAKSASEKDAAKSA